MDPHSRPVRVEEESWNLTMVPQDLRLSEDPPGNFKSHYGNRERPLRARVALEDALDRETRPGTRAGVWPCGGAPFPAFDRDSSGLCSQQLGVLWRLSYKVDPIGWTAVGSGGRKKDSKLRIRYGCFFVVFVLGGIVFCYN